jgi:hypothetical protein
MQVNCSKCSRPIAVSDVIESSAGRLSHLDCARAQGLTPEERALLLAFCSDHLVATCLSCSLELRMTEMGADPLGGRTHPCPRCRTDLAQSVRGHLFRCVRLPAEIRQKTREVRDAAQHLIKQAREAIDQSDVLIREAEAHLFECQQALRAAMARRAS